MDVIKAHRRDLVRRRTQGDNPRPRRERWREQRGQQEVAEMIGSKLQLETFRRPTLRAVITTCAPTAANAWAVAAPKALEPPVISTSLPRRSTPASTCSAVVSEPNCRPVMKHPSGPHIARSPVDATPNVLTQQ